MLQAAAAAVLAVAMLTAGPATAACPDGGLGVARVVEIDTSGGPIFGALTSQVREARFLAPREVVLTFDDGPLPRVTRSILDTLDRYCTKATFFSVGRMAVTYPDLVRDMLARGHTVGTHTWSHPILTRLSPERARDQIESGFAAVALAAGAPIAPFFRFPGLSDSPALLDHLQQRGIAAFTVDVVSNDSYISDPGRLLARTLQQAEAHNGGILLFHDIKHVTARALPAILHALKARGFSVVHLRPKSSFVPDTEYLAAVSERMQRSTRSSRALVSITDGLTGKSDEAPAVLAARGTAGDTADEEIAPVTEIAPVARNRLTNVRPAAAEAAVETSTRPTVAAQRASPSRAKRAVPAAAPTWTAGWRRRLQEAGG